MTKTLRIHRFLPGSYANGPGRRAVLWVQGCSLGCPACFNPQTHAFDGGEPATVESLRRRIVALEDTIEGITISGGEPLQQVDPLLTLLQHIRSQTSLSVLLFSGFSWAEIQRMPACDSLLACLDVLIAGRYEAARHTADQLLGSANQTLHCLTDRYTLADLQATPPAEVVITASGEIIISGVDPPAGG